MNQYVAILSLLFFGSLFWPAISSGTRKAIARFSAWWNAAPSTDTPDAPLAPNSAVTAEQAQAAELTLARFLAKADKNDTTAKLIVAGIKTLAEQSA